MRMAKASENDISALNKFLQSCEMTMERQRFGFSAPEERWLELDDEDQDKIDMLRIRKLIAQEEGYDEDQVDHRIVIYEFLKRRYQPAFGWNRVILGMDILVNCVCDPQKSYLDYAPGLEQFHVAPEM